MSRNGRAVRDIPKDGCEGDYFELGRVILSRLLRFYAVMRCNMKKTKTEDSVHFCHCIRYGRIDARKLEQLQNYRQKQICSWKDLTPFSERQEEVCKSIRSVHVKKPFFPPFCELRFVTGLESYCKRSDNREKSRNEVRKKSHSDSSRRSKETDVLHNYMQVKNKNVEDTEVKIFNSSPLRLPKLN